MMSRLVLFFIFILLTSSLYSQNNFPTDKYSKPVISKFQIIDDARLYGWKNQGLTISSERKFQYRNTLDRGMIDSIYIIASSAVENITGDICAKRLPIRKGLFYTTMIYLIILLNKHLT